MRMTTSVTEPLRSLNKVTNFMRHYFYWTVICLTIPVLFGSVVFPHKIEAQSSPSHSQGQQSLPDAPSSARPPAQPQRSLPDAPSAHVKQSQQPKPQSSRADAGSTAQP